MRCPFAVALVVLSACNPTSDAPSARERQALPAVTRVMPLPVRTIVGPETSGQLGASLSACDGFGGGFIAGAPGMAAIYAEPLNAFVRIGEVNDPPHGAGAVVLCDRAQALAFVGGPSGLWRALSDGGSDFVGEGSVRAMIRNPGDPILASVTKQDGGAQLWRVDMSMAAAKPFAVLKNSPSADYGASMAYFPFGERFLVGDDAENTVYIYKHLGDGGVQQTNRYDGGTVTKPLEKFGAALAVGNVLPDPGLEIIVSAPATNQVIIYTVDGTPSYIEAGITTAQEAPSGFGAALAIEPGNAGGGLSALWIGEPGTDRVYRCLGLTCEAFESVARRGTRFGTSLAFDRGTLVVGAPHYATAMGQLRGAVFVFAHDAGPVVGEAQYCELDAGCSAGCGAGTCVAGVVCVLPTRANCAPDEVCINNECERVDAGGPDAGEGDAGAPDAGVDAGSQPVDAGAVDGGAGGPVVFQTGCSSAPGVLAALAAALLRRRRTVSSAARRQVTPCVAG